MKNKAWYFIQIILNRMTSLIFCEKKKENNISSLSSADLANRVLMVNR